MRDQTNGSRLELLRLLTPALVAILVVLVTILLTRETNLANAVLEHHQKDILRAEVQDIYSTKNEVKEIVKRIDEKIDIILVAIKEVKK